MSFLYCKPSVFVIGQEYEILLNLLRVKFSIVVIFSLRCC